MPPKNEETNRKRLVKISKVAKKNINSRMNNIEKIKGFYDTPSEFSRWIRILTILDKFVESYNIYKNYGTQFIEKILNEYLKNNENKND